MSVTAQHVSYDLAGILVQEAVIVQASPAMAMGRIMEGLMVDYEGTIATNLTSDDNGTYTDTIKGKNGIYCLLDPDKGIVSKFDAAYKRDNWDIFIMKKVEVDRGFRLKYRKNLLGVNWAQKSDGLVTRVVPVAKDEGGADLYLPEKWIDSPMINNYPRIRMERLTVKGQIGKDKGLGDDSVWTDTDLYAEMRTKAEERFTIDKADLITQEVTVDFEMIGDTEEYQELKGLEKVLLYDTVTVEDETVGLSMQLTVTELEWDAIRKKVTALKLSNVNNRAGKNVTGYNVQAKSIGSDKLTDDVAGEILNDVRDIIPEYADPDAARPVSVTDGNPTLSWGTRSKVGSVAGTDLHVTMPANPAPAVVDNLNSTSTTDALSANMGRVLKSEIDNKGKWSTILSSQYMSFPASFGYLNKSFTLTTHAVVQITAEYNNTRPIAIGVKAGTGDYNQIFGISYINPAEVSSKATGIALTAVLEAGTYYLWGQADAAGQNYVKVRALSF